MNIKFGTDGWRGIISEDFTIENFQKVISAIAKTIKSEERRNIDIYKIDYDKHKQASYKAEYRDYKNGVAIGYDNRFMSEYFATKAAEILANYEIPVYLSETPCSTPALSLKTFKSLSAGIMITASHNPYIYNGVKYKAEYGGSATDQLTKLIEKFLSHNQSTDKPNSKSPILNTNIQKEYLDLIKEKVDLERIKSFIEKNNIFVVVDYMFGTLINSFSYLINSDHIIEINNTRNPYFGGKSPEPIPSNLSNLEKIVKMLGENTIGFAFDGDGDRIFAINNKNWITPHEILPLLTLHLYKNKKWEGKAVRTLPTSTKLKRLADNLGIETIETPVGFKYIADLFVKENILIGGEESGGIGFKNHIPERDSLLNALFILEMLSIMNKKPSEILDLLHSYTGESYCYRYDLHFKSIEEQQDNYQKIIKNIEKFKDILQIKDFEIKDYIRIIENDNNWLILRPSGTEPLIRIYSESDTIQKAENIVKNVIDKFK